jgi:cytochrome c556
MRKIAVAAFAFALFAACAPKKNTPLGDIPQLKTLEAVMDNQSTTADPEFAKIKQDTFGDADFAAFAAASARIQATSLKIKDFANGRAEFEAIAVRLNDKAKALGTAAAAKDAAGAKDALKEMKAACKDCHSKFR